jgi:hypothetical protein
MPSLMAAGWARSRPGAAKAPAAPSSTARREGWNAFGIVLGSPFVIPVARHPARTDICADAFHWASSPGTAA